MKINQYAQLAQVALDVMSQAAVKAGDQELNAVLATRAMLRGIVKGELVVGAPVPEKAPVPNG